MGKAKTPIFQIMVCPKWFCGSYIVVGKGFLHHVYEVPCAKHGLEMIPDNKFRRLFRRVYIKLIRFIRLEEVSHEQSKQ